LSARKKKESLQKIAAEKMEEEEMGKRALEVEEREERLIAAARKKAESGRKIEIEKEEKAEMLILT
jgi:hypothetical protein